VLEGHPTWLFAGLLNPLTAQRNKTLKARYWDRISEFVDRPQGRIKKGSKEGIKEPSKVVRTNQEQEQEQEQEQHQDKSKEKTTADSSEDFDTFWDHFKALGRNDAKVKTRKAWATTLKGRPGASGHKPVKPSVLIEAARHYREYCEAEKTEPRFVKQPATFLGPDRHWEDWKQKRKTNGNGTNRSLTRDPNDFKFEEA